MAVMDMFRTCYRWSGFDRPCLDNYVGVSIVRSRCSLSLHVLEQFFINIPDQTSSISLKNAFGAVVSKMVSVFVSLQWHKVMARGNGGKAMSKRSAAKHKIDRRLSVNLWGRPKSPYNTREYGPGQHGQNRRRKPSDFGIQLMAKQKLKGYYANISEKQFRRIFDEASGMKGDTGENLVGLLERRLDSVVYRMKFAKTVFQARQVINHKHFLVNGKPVNIPSYRVRDGDVIEVRQKSKQKVMILEALGLQERDIPDYVEVDEKKLAGTFLRLPQLADIPYATHMEPNLVIEFYSR